MSVRARPDHSAIKALVRDNDWIGVLAQGEHQSSFCGRGSASWSTSSPAHQQWHRDHFVPVGGWLEWVFGPVEDITR